MKKAYYRSIPIYFNPDTWEIKGRNLFYDILVDLNIMFDVWIVGINEFPIWVEDDD